MFDLMVIGGGPAGVTAALRARELGANVALVERGRMGGTCTNDGCVPTRVLAPSLSGFVVVIIWQSTQIWNEFLFGVTGVYLLGRYFIHGLLAGSIKG